MCIFLLKLLFQFLNSWWGSTNEAIRFEEEIALTVICVSGWYYTEIIQIVSLQEIFHPNIAINVALILLLVFPLVLGCIHHQFHREITKGKN